jgi:hypothetical protein
MISRKVYVPIQIHIQFVMFFYIKNKINLYFINVYANLNEQFEKVQAQFKMSEFIILKSTIKK